MGTFVTGKQNAMRLHTTLLAILLVSCPALPVAAGDCPALPEITATCVSTPQGWFYGKDSADAEGLANAAAEASTLFTRYFARPAPRGALLSTGTGASITPAQDAALKAAGAQWVLPWLDADDRRALVENRIREQVRKQLGEAATPAVVEAATAQALSQATRPGPGGDTTSHSALRHEVGHMLLTHAFWPRTSDDVRAGGRSYGGDGPDWLDETAAVLMEDDAMADSRRSRLPDVAGRTGGLMPLATFFVAQHPLAAMLEEAGGIDDGSSIRLVQGEEAARLAERGQDFYTQARAFADFLIATSGDPQVFAGITEALAAGRDMEDWLGMQGEAHHLPSNVEALQVQWQAWVDATIRAPHID